MRGWDKGVEDAIRVVRDRITFLTRIGGGTNPHIAVLVEILMYLEAMLRRGTYSSKSKMQGKK